MPRKAPEPGFLCAQHRTGQLRPLCRVDGQRSTVLRGRGQELTLHPAVRTRDKSHTVRAGGCPGGAPRGILDGLDQGRGGHRGGTGVRGQWLAGKPREVCVGGEVCEEI